MRGMHHYRGRNQCEGCTITEEEINARDAPLQRKKSMRGMHLYRGRNQCEGCTITEEDINARDALLQRKKSMQGGTITEEESDCSFKIHRPEKVIKKTRMFKRNDIEYHSSPNVQCKPTSTNIPQEMSTEEVHGSATDDGRVRNLSATCLRGKLPLAEKGKSII